MEQDSIKATNQISQLELINARIAQICDKKSLPDTVRFNLELILEELFTNIVQYGYSDNDVHFIEITFEYNSSTEMTVRIEDDAKAFNPLEHAADENVDKEAHERPIGGLGIHLVKEFAQNVQYKRQGPKNIIEIILSLKA